SNNRMKFNLELRGDTNRKLWAEDYMLGGKMPTTNPLQSGVDLPDYIGALGTSAIVEYSNNYYTKICMVYTLYGEWPLESGERCNDLVDTESKLTIAEMNQKQQLPQDVADAVATSDTYIPPTRQSI
ncbi:hypothetical protein KY328_05875, partial [Candidatus Woesearchaeota archaeon]|nr:hypothetical protein [Candidatus Woesearchaeota archaeon]